jgi:prolyl-tRNA synthetase
MNATVLNENGKATVMTMGCYGLGVTRTVAAAIEQNNDENGIAWPIAIAPFHLAIVPINYHRSERVRAACEVLYKECQAAGIEVLLDDRNERPGVMFNDIELIGIPFRFALGERALDKDQIEFKRRSDESSTDIPLTGAVSFIKEKLTAII